MKRENINTYIAVLLLMVLLFSLLAITAFGEKNDSSFLTSARSAVLYLPETDNFIYSKNADTRMPMASTTKIMTALVAMENCDFSKVVEVNDSAIGVEGSSAYLRLGDRLTMEELLYALLLQSANDAAVAIACHISGDVESFSALMNEKALELGLTDTHFTNPHGLDNEEHFTTARELAIIAAEAMKNPDFRRIVSTYKRTFSTEERVRTYVNHNKLLKLYEGCNGVKTGFTKRSGRCLVSAAERDGLSFVAVTLDAPSDWSDHRKMLDFGFKSYEKLTIAQPFDHIYKLPVIDGQRDSILAANCLASEIIREREDKEICKQVKLVRYAIAPINRGDILGEIIYTEGGRELSRVPIVATESVEKKEQDGFLSKILSIFD